MTVGGWGMIVGAAIWLTFELYGVATKGQTTSGWVWNAEKKWPAARAIVAFVLLLLGLHFEFHTPLWLV
jgi:hypothetical protein